MYRPILSRRRSDSPDAPARCARVLARTRRPAPALPLMPTLALALALTAVLLLAGCTAPGTGAGPTTGPTPTPGATAPNDAAPSDSPAPTGTPTPDARGRTAPDSGAVTPAPPRSRPPKLAPVPSTVPTCDSMNLAVAAAHLAFGPELFTTPVGETDLATFTATAGPAAREAVARVATIRGCQWPVNFHNVVTEYVAVQAQAEQTALIATLRTSDFVESTLGPATVFTYTSPPLSAAGSTTTVYLFVGDVWISLFTGVLPEGAAQAALDAVLAANPHLAATNG